MSIKIQANPSASGSTPTGGLTYKGSYDAALQSPNLDSSLKGDFYIVSDAGSLAGVALNVGDHIVFNQDASSPITSAMFDVIDNTDAVASVNGATGVVVLDTGDISENGNLYFTSGRAYVAADARIGAADLTDLNDVSYTAGPGIDNFVLTYDNTSNSWGAEASGAAPVSSVNTQTGAVVLSASDVSALAIANNLSDLNNAGTARTNLGLGSAATKDTGTSNGQVVLLDAVGLPAVDGSQLTNITATDATKLAIANNLSDLNNVGTARTNLGLGTSATEDVGTGANDIVQLDGSSRLPAVDGSQLTNVTGTDSTKLAIANNLSDLNNAGTARTNLGLAIGSDVQAFDAQLTDVAGLTPADGAFIVGDGSNFVTETLGDARTSLGLGTVATLDVGTGANQVVQLTAASKLPAVDGSLLTNLPGGGDLLASNNLSDLDNAGTARTNLGLAIGSDVQAFDAQLTDVAGLTPTDSNIIIGDGSNFITESGATARTSLGLSIGSDVQAFDAQLTDIAGLTPTDSHIIIGDGSNFVTESGATARTSLGLGTVATLDVGTGANQVVQMTAAAKLPAVDGSLLTNLPSGGGLTYQARDTTTHSPLTPLANYHYSINANSATMVINLPALSSFTDGDQIRVKFQARGDAARDVTINRNGADTIDGQTSVTLDVLYSSVTLVAGSSEWEIV